MEWCPTNGVIRDVYGITATKENMNDEEKKGREKEEKTNGKWKKPHNIVTK